MVTPTKPGSLLPTLHLHVNPYAAHTECLFPFERPQMSISLRTWTPIYRAGWRLDEVNLRLQLSEEL